MSYPQHRPEGVKIKEIEESELAKFFDYLSEHLAGNSKPLFQPTSANHSGVSDGMKLRFTNGVTSAVGAQGWRKLWIAVDEQNTILGHIDLRPHSEEHTEHRVLLGMGVDVKARRMGLGKRLIQLATSWAYQQPMIEWIDLWVISSNLPAIGLYESTGFIKNGEINDMFRIDGESYSYTQMSHHLSDVAT